MRVRFFDPNAEYVTLAQLFDWVRNHPLPDGRLVPVFLWGSAGTGKCILGDTPVFVDGCPVTMEALFERYADELEHTDADGGQWYAPIAPLHVQALDQDGRLTAAPVTHIYRQPVREWGRRVLLDDGSSITMTQAHRLHGLDDWQRDIAVGDRICVPSVLRHQGEDIDPDLVSFIVWQVSEGYENRKCASFNITQKDVRVLERLQASGWALGEAYGVKMNGLPIRRHSSRSASCIAGASVEYRAFLEGQGYVWGHNSAKKRLPEFIVRGSDKTVRLALRELYAAEGHVHKNSTQVEMTLASRALLDQVAVMLRRFGIWLRISEKWACATNGTGIKRQYWKGTITGASFYRFRELVSIADPVKQARLDGHPHPTPNTNVEGIPVDDLIEDIRARTRLGYKFFGVQARKAASRPVAEKMLARLEAIASGELLAHYEANSANHGNRPVIGKLRRINPDDVQRWMETLSARLGREVFYARVVAVEPVWLEEDVFDLEVAEHHNYIAGSGAGIVTHNTQIIKGYCAQNAIAIKTYAPAHDVDGQGIVGTPIIDQESGKTTHAVPEHIPTEADGPAGIWFIDEINRGNEAVLAGLMEPIGEGTISQSDWTLPPGWMLVAAANPRESGYQVRELDEAMLNRAIHYAPGWDGPNWAQWAEGAGVADDIIDFALASEEHVNSGEHQLPQELQEKLKPSPRTLTYLAALYEPGMPDGLLEVITDGLLNRAAATQFREFVKIGERPITYEQAVSEDNTAHEQLVVRAGSWVATMADPAAAAEQRSACRLLLRASLMRIIGGLSKRVYEAPAEGEQVNESELLAQRASAFFALVPQELHDEVWDAVKYSAASWEGPLHRCAERWNQYWAEQHAAQTAQENQIGA